MKYELDTKPRYTTGIVADFLGMNPRTLMNYECADMIHIERSKTGRRLFSKKDIFDLLIIRYMVTERRLQSNSVCIILSMLAEGQKKGVNLYQSIIDKEVLKDFYLKVKDL